MAAVRWTTALGRRGIGAWLRSWLQLAMGFLERGGKEAVPGPSCSALSQGPAGAAASRHPALGSHTHGKQQSYTQGPDLSVSSQPGTKARLTLPLVLLEAPGQCLLLSSFPFLQLQVKGLGRSGRPQPPLQQAGEPIREPQKQLPGPSSHEDLSPASAYQERQLLEQERKNQ